MYQNIPWGEDLVSPINETIDENSGIGLEYLQSELTQGRSGCPVPAFFKPVNIAVENGVYYVTIYVCQLFDQDLLTTQFALWLGSCKETDRIRLTVCSTITGIPNSCLIMLLTALANTKAQIEIMHDQIVMDNLAYFYLLADKIVARYGGGLFIPSYTEQRIEDASLPWKAVHDFFSWIVEDSVKRKLLTEEEGERLHKGSPVAFAPGRLSL